MASSAWNVGIDIVRPVILLCMLSFLLHIYRCRKISQQMFRVQNFIHTVQYSIYHTGQISLAMKEIQTATVLAHVLKSDGTMRETRYLLPQDQMLAVFSPLLLPLIAPLLLGLIREVKRYKKLSNGGEKLKVGARC